MLRALILEDDEDSRVALATLVEQEGFTVASAGTLAEAREQLTDHVPDIALVDQFLPDGSGLELLEQLDVSTEAVLITGHANVESAIEALRLRVRDYLVKPIDVLRLRTILSHVIRTRQLKREVEELRSALLELGRFGPLIGSSTAMQRVYDEIGRVAPTELSVLVTGESGTGKELVAQALHGLSARREGPWRAVNCGAISPSLIESELFGHERGAFTGATRQHRGVFEQSDGGTLFLDEIADMPMELQVKLLRVLETGTLHRVGGEKATPVDVRVVAATNRDPEEAVTQGRLREDLFYRLGSFRIRLPPLRERDRDVELLADHFRVQLNRDHGVNKRFGPGVSDRLLAHSWPGNVRELRNMIQQAWVVSDEEIPAAALPLGNGAAREAPASGERVSLEVGTSLAEAERRLTLMTLERLGGDKRRAADVLGISLKTLYNRLRSYGVH